MDEVHRLRDAQMQRAAENGDNMIMTVKPKKDKLFRLGRLLKAHGYETQLIFIDAKNTPQRVQRRMTETGRYDIDFWPKSDGKKVAKVYEELKDSPLFSRCVRFDNNVPKEEAQRRIREFAE